MPPREIPEKFLVAFSFAGEQRDLVRSIAEAVEDRLGRSTVFLDEWYEAWIAGSDADTLLQDIYNKRCALTVVCVSERLGHKSWTLAELDAIHARVNKARNSASDKDRQGVMPIRVGDGDVPGIFLETWIVPDVRPPKRSMDETVELIVDRLRLAAPEIQPAAAQPIRPPRPNMSTRRVNLDTPWPKGSWDTLLGPDGLVTLPIDQAVQLALISLIGLLGGFAIVFLASLILLLLSGVSAVQAVPISIIIAFYITIIVVFVLLNKEKIDSLKHIFKTNRNILIRWVLRDGVFVFIVIVALIAINIIFFEWYLRSHAILWLWVGFAVTICGFYFSKSAVSEDPRRRRE